MRDIQNMIYCLENSPIILKNLVDQIDPALYKVARRPGKWTIHENACHLPEAELMLYDRFISFRDKDNPVFEFYKPGTTFVENLLDHDLGEQLELFEVRRDRTTTLLKSFTPEIWEKQGNHPEYMQYSCYILLRHMLMHDHFHMYRIEELGFTNPEFI